MSELSASLNMNSSLGPGKVRAMFQARRNGGSSAQGSPVGWDKSYPLEPIQRGTPPHKATPPHRAGQQQKRAPPAKSGARFSPPQATVSGGGRKPPVRAGNTLRKAKSHNNLVAEPAKRAGKLSRSNSLGARGGRRKPPHRAEDRSHVSDEVRRRDGEQPTKNKGNEREPAGLQAGTRRRSKAPAKARSPAPPAMRGGNTTRSGGRSPAPPRAAGSRRPSFTPYKENKPEVAPTPRPPPTDPKMAQCPICTRSFAKDRLEKHQAICEKTSQKKRKTFDQVKMRVQGTGSEQYIKKIKSNKPDKSPAKKVDWRKQHEEFVQNIREAKKAQAHVDAGGDIRDLPPPPPQDTSHYVQCPHCDRKFNEAAAERHIPKCSSIESNKGAGRRGRDGGGGRKRR